MEEPKNDWQEPPLPEMPAPAAEPAQMSEIATIGNIFFDPGATFEDLRRKPRFVIGAVIIAILATVWTFGLAMRVGDDGMRRWMTDQFDKNPRTASMTGEQKQQAISLQLTIMKYTRFAVPVFACIGILLGGLFYWVGGKAFGGQAGFLQSVSVFIYSSLPPTILFMVENVIVLFLKSTDEIDFGAAQRGLVKANALMFWDGTGMPVLATLVSVIDLFAIWGWILAAIGLRIMNKISSASAWAITIIIALIGIALRVVGAFTSGNPS
ncbi:MAG TPA: Yip1 family protein [Pyrinomonadaceae bacterium]|nr:Yip1 family protein [Pyrinomonadaceae bacterium]